MNTRDTYLTLLALANSGRDAVSDYIRTEMYKSQLGALRQYLNLPITKENLAAKSEVLVTDEIMKRFQAKEVTK